MRNVVLMAATIFAMQAAPVVASAQNADVIDGYRTNDFFRFWPDKDESPDGYRLKKKNSNPAAHMTTAEYEAEDKASFANIRIFGWPLNKPEPVSADDKSVIDQSIAGTLQNIKDQGWEEPEQFEITTPDGKNLSCLKTLQTKQAEFVYCATSVKGRVMEIQHLASVEARPEDERERVAKEFVQSLSDHIAGAE